MNARRYKVTPPVGNTVLSTETLSEAELREFVGQIAGNDPVWDEKSRKDTISEVVEWMRIAGYIVEEI